MEIRNIIGKKIAEFAEINKTDFSKIERKAGLSKNFISSIVYGKSKNPGIDSIIKLATVLGISIDELVGNKSSNNIENISINNINLLLEILIFIKGAMSITTRELQTYDIFNAVNKIYLYSESNQKLDLKFAEWYIETHIHNRSQNI